MSNPNDSARLAAFVFEGALTSVLMEELHRSRRRAEENRREAEGFREASWLAKERLRAIINNTDAIIYLKDSKLKYLILNRTLLDITGVAPAEAVGLSDHDVFPPSVAEEIQTNDRRVLRD
jgi:PAS domain-containing protein